MKKQLRTRFRLLVGAQIALLVSTVFLLTWTIYATELYAVPVVVGVLVLLQVVFLLRNVESHVHALEDFFAAVNYEDFTQRFIAEDVDAELKEAFNHVLARFQDSRADRDVQAGYLETVVRHIPVPFFAARADGSLALVNNPARRLTGIATLTHLDQLSDLDPNLPKLVSDIKPGDKELLPITLRGVPSELRVSVSEIRLSSGVNRLYSLENLSGELTAREASAWRNLIRVLTHEIMNTLTPVTSLANTATGLLDHSDANGDVREAVETIARRSEGLMNFVQRYRELLNVPQPQISRIKVSDVFASLKTLMRGEIEHVDVAIDVIPVSLEVDADPALLDQVLVNLVRNALDAMQTSERPKLRFQGGLSHGRIQLSVEDNGSGMDAETQAQIFVPFFTTKRQGNGIGLSLSRQIMSAHDGDIAVESNESGTIVRLLF